MARVSVLLLFANVPRHDFRRRLDNAFLEKGYNALLTASSFQKIGDNVLLTPIGSRLATHLPGVILDAQGLIFDLKVNPVTGPADRRSVYNT